MAHQPLLTTRTVRSVDRARLTTLRAIADGVIDLQEQRDIRAALAEADGDARHADYRERYAEALRRGACTDAYLERLRLNARAEELPLDAA